MRKAVIIESFDDCWEEIDMIMENEEGNFVVLVRGKIGF